VNIEINEMLLRTTHIYIRIVAVSVVLFASTACESLEGVGDIFSGWGDSLSDAVTSVNPLGAEVIAIGRAVPQFAGNTFVSDGERGIRMNYSYDFRLVGSSNGLIEEKETSSWLFIDRLLENGETYLQFHRVENANLEDFGEAESAFIDRTNVASQFHCLGRNSKDVPAYVSGYLNVIAGEGLPVPAEYLLRRFTENMDRKGMTHRVDVVYIEDVLRAGYTCEDIGNLLLPSSDAIKIYLEAFKKRSERSFAIVG